ncbi:hypothetical protein BDY19DRAFT_909717 [Irpex rosettiformis]|uniref:Uncharacterized protein n=1 Tax=Irpex rosettiformis TaxID=378272 RepID=A0ACB8TRJ3_9APHY|nr:hypothetical protein BDY19DRAFT_909717 [Irpex rosettiformis]
MSQPIVIFDEHDRESISFSPNEPSNNPPMNSFSRPVEIPRYYSEDIQLPSPTFAPATVFENVLVQASQTEQIAPNPTLSSQDSIPSNLNIWLNTGPVALSIAGVVIMGINVLTFAVIIVVATFVYKRQTRGGPVRLSLDTSNLSYQRPGSGPGLGHARDYNAFELKDRIPSNLQSIQEDTTRLGSSYDRSPSPATPSSFKFPFRNGPSLQPPPETSIHPIPIPKKKLSLSSLSNFTSSV